MQSRFQVPSTRLTMSCNFVRDSRRAAFFSAFSRKPWSHAFSLASSPGVNFSKPAALNSFRRHRLLNAAGILGARGRRRP